ncbi:class I SAM-dependent methyltransferase [Patescibacteria group bacterium]|nr:class I SAM-dependent methyltransferase [Patescibacteria group bacterium]MBU1722086.1 class I SAM-dependent methyltransferase [Patescibacteria group bacterium]MBU1901366.1 class I SAM-dependent methyltransferase [Patescibacteria group bacterium]
MQVKSEIQRLLSQVKKQEPKVVVEIGTANGGTLFLFTRVADASADIYSIDLPGGAFGGGYAFWKKRLYKAFARKEQTIHLIRANSHETKTKERLEKKLKGRQIDVLFIDGDHSYEGVKQDFELYQDLVRPGGLIGFHDVAKHTPERNCHVDQYWQEIKQKYSKQWEFIQKEDQGWGGIGLIQKNK